MDSQSEQAISESNAQKFATTDKLLRVSELRYRRLFEAAQDVILLLNAKTAQIEDANPFLIQMLGYTHEEFLGKKLWEIGAFKDTALNKEAFDELQTKHYIRYDDLPLEAKDGSRVSVEFISNVYDCDGTQHRAPQAIRRACCIRIAR
jgi:PAS domain S-box-containing protein